MGKPSRFWLGWAERYVEMIEQHGAIYSTGDGDGTMLGVFQDYTAFSPESRLRVVELIARDLENYVCKYDSDIDGDK